MKKEILVNTRIVKEYGCTAAVVLAVVNSAVEPLSNTEVAQMVGISFPTAQRCLQILAENNHIKTAGKLYTKI